MISWLDSQVLELSAEPTELMFAVMAEMPLDEMFDLPKAKGAAPDSCWRNTASRSRNLSASRFSLPSGNQEQAPFVLAKRVEGRMSFNPMDINKKIRVPCRSKVRFS